MTTNTSKLPVTPNITVKVSKQLYFLPEFGVSVKATSLEEAIILAKKVKGVK